MMMWRAMMAVTAALALVACQSEPEAHRTVQHYDCAGIPVRADFLGQSLILSLQNTRHQLQRSRTVSGAKYDTPEGKHPKLIFWEKGDSATLTRGPNSPLSCVKQTPPQPPLTAIGQEPGWRLNLSESTLTLNYQYGQKQFSAPTPELEPTDNGARYLTRNNGKTLVLDLTRDYCEDSMSGMPYPYSATVTLAGQTLNGCAGDSKALLVGPEWVVEDINGQGIIDSSRITLNFTENGNVQGLAGCNRFNGRYRLTDAGLRIEKVAQTRMACVPALMQQEDKLLKTLTRVARFRLDKTGALHLEGGGGAALKAYRSWKVE